MKTGDIDVSGTLSLPNITNVESSLSNLETDVSGLQSDVSGLQSDVSGLQSDVSGLQSDVSGLQSDVSGLQSDVSGLQSDVSGLQSDVSGLQSDVSGLQSDVSGLQSDVSGLQSDVSGLQSDVSGLQSDVSGLQSDVSLGTFTGSFIPDNQTIKGALQSLETKLQNFEGRPPTPDVLIQAVEDTTDVSFDVSYDNDGHPYNYNMTNSSYISSTDGSGNVPNLASTFTFALVADIIWDTTHSVSDPSVGESGLKLVFDNYDPNSSKHRKPYLRVSSNNQSYTGSFDGTHRVEGKHLFVITGNQTAFSSPTTFPKIDYTLYIDGRFYFEILDQTMPLTIYPNIKFQHQLDCLGVFNQQVLLSCHMGQSLDSTRN